MPESRKAWSVVVGAAVLFALLVIGIVPRWRDHAELGAAATGLDAGLVPVSVATPQRGDGSNDLVLPSNIQAIEETAIYARANGYIRERSVADEKRNTHAVARATTVAAQANVEATQANIGVLEASVDAARANVAANEANVQRLRALQSFQTLEAPFSGIITMRGIDRGALITAGSGTGASPLFRLARIDTLRIFVNVPQTFVRSIALGQRAEVLVPEYPQRTFVGTVASTAGALDHTSRTLLTEVRLRNDDRALLPGMYAQVKFAVASADDVWIVPATALVTRAAGPQVVAVRDDGTVRYVRVQVGRDLGPSVEIVSGLGGQERLVTSPPDGLKDGARVTLEQRAPGRPLTRPS